MQHPSLPASTLSFHQSSVTPATARTAHETCTSSPVCRINLLSSVTLNRREKRMNGKGDDPGLDSHLLPIEGELYPCSAQPPA